MYIYICIYYVILQYIMCIDIYIYIDMQCNAMHCTAMSCT